MLPGHQKQIYFFLYCFLNLFIAGNAYTCLAPLILRLEFSFDPETSFTPEEISWMISLCDLGSLVSSLPAVLLGNKCGKRNILIGTLLLNQFAWTVLMTSYDMWAFCIGRFFLGVANGSLVTLTPMFLAEVAEESLRQKLVDKLNAAFFCGAVFSFIVAPFVDYFIFLCVCITPPLIAFMLTNAFPQSPTYLLKIGKEEIVIEMLNRYRDNADINQELETIKYDSSNYEIGFLASCSMCDTVERRSFNILQIVSAVKVLTGLPVLLNYSLKLFSISNISMLKYGAEICSIILALTMAVFSFFSAALHRSFRLSQILVLTCFASLCFHLLSGTFFLIHRYNPHFNDYLWMLLLGLVGYSIFAVLGFSFQTQFGAGFRCSAMGINNTLSSFFSFIVLKMFNPLNEIKGYDQNFWFYSSVSLFGALVLTCALRPIPSNF